MTDQKIFEKIKEGKGRLGVISTKYSGHLTVEVIRTALRAIGIHVSPRDVFIQGLPFENDLLILRKGIDPKYGLLYRSRDVAVVLEIKNAGSFGKHTIEQIQNHFNEIRKLDKSIYCAYLALAERKGYKWAITKQNTGFPAYTLFWHSGSGSNELIEPTGDWRKLIKELRRRKLIKELRKRNG